MTNTPKNIQEPLDQIIGNPAEIEKSTVSDDLCLFQAFANAVTAFEQSDLPDGIKFMVFQALETRVNKSIQQPNAKICFDRFKKYYGPSIRSLSTSSNITHRRRDRHAPRR